MCAWNSKNQKADGLLFLTQSDVVKNKINKPGFGINGHLLWATLESYYTTADPATRLILMSQFHTISHDLSQRADTFLQAVVTAEHRLMAIAASLSAHMVQDKLLSGLSLVYSPIITLLQAESPQRGVSSGINGINAWERADLQHTDSVIKAARATKDIDDANKGCVFAAAARVTHPSHRADTSQSSAGKEFNWTNTKNRMNVCNRCGLPGHFAQFCISIMPNEVRRHILRDHERHAQAAEAEHDSDSANESVNHVMAAVLNLPNELHINTMDPDLRQGWLSTIADHVKLVSVSDLRHFSNIHTPNPHPAPPSPTLTSVTGTPTKKKKKKKKKKKVVTVNNIQSTFQGMSLVEKEEESDYRGVLELGYWSREPD
ncbi:hypothetical protein DFH07DRAFT_777759 [Mycena maculata]|uniref:CCHC-type domain-containing protein n=1 Tax=Mycena maculata TaxID=230809 RepID=A0AAD7N293_9AGAR|nr:hypothetical protein DFH07DRAFT_777759 [Mycena maculata]